LLALGRAPIGDDKDGKPREEIAGARARYRNVPDRKMRSFRGIACSGDRKAVLGKKINMLRTSGSGLPATVTMPARSIRIAIGRPVSQRRAAPITPPTSQSANR